MINPERLLGGIIEGALSGAGKGFRRQGRSSRGSGKLGMGLLGVAIAAYEHFVVESQKREGSGGRAGSIPSSVPPPPPGALPPRESPTSTGAATEVVRPPPPPGQANTITEKDALLLIRVMIAAANADGAIDIREKQKVFERISKEALSDEELQFLEAEFASPLPLNAVLAEVKSNFSNPAEYEQVYLAALIATNNDHERERLFLQGLAEGLGLSEAQTEEINDLVS